MSYRQIAQCR